MRTDRPSADEQGNQGESRGGVPRDAAQVGATGSGTATHAHPEAGEATWHKDHIFPQSWFTWSALGMRGLSGEERERLQDASNRIANLQLLTQEENIAKSDKAFEEWILTRDHDFRARHLIPDDDDLLRRACRAVSSTDSAAALTRSGGR